jgi:menaquinone reductase, multiheme cytochrome c subunit
MMDRNNFPERTESRMRSSILIFVLSFSCLLIAGWVVYPELLYSHRSQPVDFNHRLHAKITDDGCESCHSLRLDGSFSGIPDIETCRTCHVEVVKEGLNEKRLIRDYIEKETEIPWLVYARQPDSVFFSHAAHIKTAQLTCENCHGNIGQSTELKTYEENRLTGYSRDIWGSGLLSADGMKMNDCVACHHQKGHAGTSVQTQKEGCFVCHK